MLPEKNHQLLFLDSEVKIPQDTTILLITFPCQYKQVLIQMHFQQVKHHLETKRNLKNLKSTQITKENLFNDQNQALTLFLSQKNKKYIEYNQNAPQFQIRKCYNFYLNWEETLNLETLKYFQHIQYNIISLI